MSKSGVEKAWRQMLSDRLGLGYSEHSPLLNTAIQRLCRRFDMTASEALDVLQKCTNDNPMWQHVRDEVVVSSSRFFRDPEMYATLEQWLAPRGVEPMLNAISYGSADGREAYSLAMLFSEAACRFEIIGVDISPRALKQAHQAQYSTRDIDEIPVDMQAKYTAPAANNRFTLVPQIRDKVRFVDPADLGDEEPLCADLICCQNTLMYLTREQQMAHLQWFEEHLNPGGLLLLSPTDQPQWRGKRLQRYASPRVRALHKPMEDAA